MTDPFERVLIALGDRVVKRSRTGAAARCPAHDDRNPSLSISIGGEAKAAGEGGSE